MHKVTKKILKYSIVGLLIPSFSLYAQENTRGEDSGFNPLISASPPTHESYKTSEPASASTTSTELENLSPYERAEKYLESDNGKDALKELVPLLCTNPSFKVYIAAAQASADINRPHQALNYYQLALDLATDPDDIKDALFGMGKMQVWIGDYSDSEITYVTLLDMNLSHDDNQDAFAGLVKTYAMSDRSKEAYNFIPDDFHYTTEDMVVAGAQAALWADWPQKSKIVIEDNQAIITKMDPKSDDYQKIGYVEREVAEATAINTLSPIGYWDGDDEGFLIKRYTLQYMHRFAMDNFFNYFANDAVTTFYVSSLNYSQASNINVEEGTVSGTIDGVGYGIQENWFWDYASASVRLGSAKLHAWDLFLWSVQAAYIPNDFFEVKIVNYNEIVESYLAVLNHVSAYNTELQVSITPSYRLKFDGSINYQVYNDSNTSRGFYSSLDYLIVDDLGLWIGGRTRGFTDTNPGSPNYFDPEFFAENMVFLKVNNHFYHNWYYYVDAGIGKQNIIPGDLVPAKSIEAGLTAPFAKYATLEAFIGYTTSAYASSSTVTPAILNGSYRRKYGGIQFNFFGF